jgi:hypothetical protein
MTETTAFRSANVETYKVAGSGSQMRGQLLSRDWAGSGWRTIVLRHWCIDSTRSIDRASRFTRRTRIIHCQSINLALQRA